MQNNRRFGALLALTASSTLGWAVIGLADPVASGPLLPQVPPQPQATTSPFSLELRLLCLTVT